MHPSLCSQNLYLALKKGSGRSGKFTSATQDRHALSAYEGYFTSYFRLPSFFVLYGKKTLPQRALY